ncbi:MAG: 50S ribosomal protein L10 [Clostridia bacterium]|nr:50S ribosomal protein L10 [Clostridia bacterium]MBQ3496227.1 50S ribosomal protein L10 [Clostridia bacterium]MBQ4586595.1 50S ribosomal protein L10 [Clostridia bacterium]MBQ6884097.1 50S ribosomal protein L10 [Clostridia bacterium]MBR2933392.1 50S ribosomal protein L10 [Clostridia bacterium]
MSANIENKKQVVDSIKSEIQAAKSVVFVNYKGLTVLEDTEFRNAFRKANCKYKVLKNTMVRKAFNELGITCFDEDLNGPTAVAFGSDETAAAKVVVEACKKYNDRISVKSAYVDGQYIDVNGVKALSAMPSKEELIAKMLGSMQAPISNFVGALSGITRKLVIALNAVAEKKA